MQKLRAIFGGFSPIAVTALLSVAILGTVSIVRVVALIMPPAAHVAAADAMTATSTDPVDAETLQRQLLLGEALATDAAVASTTDHLSLITPMVTGQILGSYEALRSGGSYTKADLQNAATQIASTLKAAVPYEAFKDSDLKTDPDVSIERVRTYRDDLQRTLAPLAAIPGAEYEIYAQYLETKDPTYLTQLSDAANTYRAVANAGAALTIPRDAITYHRDVLNSLRAFSSVLDGLAEHPEDPYASVALLRTYNEKEQGIYDAYNHMRAYYGKKGL